MYLSHDKEIIPSPRLSNQCLLGIKIQQQLGMQVHRSSSIDEE
jgi:hypothetical protein